LESQDATPDETTLCRFRNILIKKGLDEELFVEFNRQLEQLGIKIEKATGAVVEATIISSASRPKRTLENPVQDREEPEKDTNSLSYWSAPILDSTTRSTSKN
jgi:transposase, IS5 family